MMDRRLLSRGGAVRLKWIALGWIAAEIVVFAVLVRVLGIGTTILLGLGTTVMGAVMMRRVGVAALSSLRGAVDGRQPAEGALLEGMLGGLAALLLIVPGFLANFAGLALAAPSVRHRVMLSYGGSGGGRMRARKASPEVLDLGPADWQAVDGP